MKKLLYLILLFSSITYGQTFELNCKGSLTCNFALINNGDPTVSYLVTDVPINTGLAIQLFDTDGEPYDVPDDKTIVLQYYLSGKWKDIGYVSTIVSESKHPLSQFGTHVVVANNDVESVQYRFAQYDDNQITYGGQEINETFTTSGTFEYSNTLAINYINPDAIEEEEEEGVILNHIDASDLSAVALIFTNLPGDTPIYNAEESQWFINGSPVGERFDGSSGIAPTLDYIAWRDKQESVPYLVVIEMKSSWDDWEEPFVDITIMNN